MKYKRDQKGVSLVMVVLGLATLLGFAALAIDMGNAFNVQNELQKTTTTAALTGAAAYNKKLPSSQNLTNIQQAVEDSFNLSKKSQPGLEKAEMVGNVQVDTDSGAIRLQTKAQAPTYFIGLIGIRTLEVNARAAALNYPMAYIVMNDLFPIPPADQKKTIAFAETDDMTATNVYYYHSYPGGRVQIVCTLPLVNTQGPEITVTEAGDLDGYYVYVATDPAGPWYNVSGQGVSTNGGPGPQDGHPVVNAGRDGKRFFGSGSFDLEGCGIENARYVAILDDMAEDGYLEADPATYLNIGAFSSSAANEGGTAMEIDAIYLHQHSQSISYDDLSTDADNDGVIDAYNQVIGTYDKPGQAFNDPTSSAISASP